jgi:hypothetical protein
VEAIQHFAARPQHGSTQRENQEGSHFLISSSSRKQEGVIREGGNAGSDFLATVRALHWLDKTLAVHVRGVVAREQLTLKSILGLRKTAKESTDWEAAKRNPNPTQLPQAVPTLYFASVVESRCSFGFGRW